MKNDFKTSKSFKYLKFILFFAVWSLYQLLKDNNNR